MNARLFGMITSASSMDYTPRALDSFFVNTAFTENDEFYLIDNDNVYTQPVDDRVTIIRNLKPLSFSHNVNQLINIAKQADSDLIFLSNDIILTPDWLPPLEAVDNTIVIPSCNQTHQYYTPLVQLASLIDWENYNHNYEELHNIVLHHRQTVTGYFDLLLMPFYVFRLPKNVYNAVGLLDTEYINGGEDVDYRLRAILAGFDVKYAAASYIIHFYGKSTWRSQEDQAQIEDRNKKYRARFKEKWGEDLLNLMILGGDPNSVLIKHELMNFNYLTDSFNKLIKEVEFKCHNEY